MKRKALVKASAAIAVKDQLSFMESKIWDVMLAHAYTHLPHQDRYELPARLLLNELDFAVKDYRQLEEYLESLRTQPIVWNLFEKDRQEWGVSSAIAEWSIDSDLVIRWSYPPVLRTLLYEPKMYAKLDLPLQNKFRSKYTYKLYQLCTDYFDEKRAESETPWFSLYEMNELFGTNYKQYTYLKKNVLDKAAHELIQHTQFSVAFRPKRLNRVFREVKIIMQVKLKPTPPTKSRDEKKS